MKTISRKSLSLDSAELSDVRSEHHNSKKTVNVSHGLPKKTGDTVGIVTNRITHAFSCKQADRRGGGQAVLSLENNEILRRASGSQTQEHTDFNCSKAKKPKFFNYSRHQPAEQERFRGIPTRSKNVFCKISGENCPVMASTEKVIKAMNQAAGFSSEGLRFNG